MKKLKHIRWGIIGCGNVAEVKSGPAFDKANNSSLVAVMRRNANKAKDYALRHGVQNWYSDADALINDPDVDAVYVATPPDSHAFYTKKIIECGKPVYVEKPMAHSYQECLEMINVSEKYSIPLYVAYYRRSLSYFLKVKELLDSHAIGKPRSFSIHLYLPPRNEDLDRMNPHWRVKSDIAGAGYFYDMGSHQVDLIDFFFGPISWTKGVSTNQAGLYEVEDMVAAMFGYDSGLTGIGQWIFTTHQSAKTDLFEIVGSEGKISFSSFEFTPIILKNTRGEQLFDLKPPQHIQQPMIQSVVNDLIHHEFVADNSRAAARTSKIMDVILGRYDA